MMDLPETTMSLRSRETLFAVLTTAVVVTILLLCLYPFRFSAWHGDADAIGALARSWATPPHAVDFILNIVLYTPLGAFGALSFRRPRTPKLRIGVVTFGGALLSIAVELTQYFDRWRITAATDVYANVLGTFLAAVAVIVLFRQ